MSNARMKKKLVLKSIIMEIFDDLQDVIALNTLNSTGAYSENEINTIITETFNDLLTT